MNEKITTEPYSAKDVPEAYKTQVYSWLQAELASDRKDADKKLLGEQALKLLMSENIYEEQKNLELQKERPDIRFNRLAKDKDGNVIGMARGKKDEKGYYLSHLYVDSDTQGLGVGKQLTEEFLDWAKENDAENIYTIVDSGNLQAVNFYKKMGFIEVPGSEKQKGDALLVDYVYSQAEPG